MRLVLALFWTLGLAAAAAAQPVEIRSGQHESFTRLIVDLPERAEFEVQNFARQAQVSFPGRSFAFDPSSVFSRISRERIAEISVTEGESAFSIKLNCQCEVTSFWHDRSLLVLDVRPTEKKFAEFEPDEQIEVEPEIETAELEAPKAPPRRIPVTKVAGSLAATLANDELKPNEVTEPVEPEVLMDPSPEGSEVDTESLRAAREQLVRQLSRAASQGLLSPSTNLQSMAGKDSEPEEPEIPEKSPAQPEPKAIVNLRAQSSIDRDFLEMLGQVPNGFSSVVCLAEDEIDVGNWASEASFPVQVGALRRDLTGEFDELDVDIALQLARLYIHFGFGLEARDVLMMSGDEPSGFELLLSLAEIVEHGHANRPTELFSQLECDGPSALWSALAHEVLPENQKVNSDAVLRTFSALPIHLRRHLGPILSRRFLEAGDRETADDVLNILDRNDTTVTADAELVAAEIHRAEGKPVDAVETMEGVVEANSVPSAEALIRLIDTSVEAGLDVSFEQALLAGSYAQQHRGETLEPELARVYLVGLSASGAFEQAYEEHARLAQSLTSETSSAVNRAMLHQLTERADDINFLKFALSHHMKDIGDLTPRIANGAAQRLVDIGFPDQARAFLTTNALGESAREQRLLRARIALTGNRPRDAEKELLGLESTEADRLRALARSQIGDHSASAALHSKTGDQAEANRQAWLAEDWEALIDNRSSSYSNGAALARLPADGDFAENDTESASQEPRVLARKRNLIQQSTAARVTIQEILEASSSSAIEEN